MTGKVNRLAVEYANRFNVPVTGGSDAHILQEIGSVITGVRADSIGDFLDGIREGESIVIGSSSGIVSRGMTAGVIAYHYVPYSVTRPAYPHRAAYYPAQALDETVFPVDTKTGARLSRGKNG